MGEESAEEKREKALVKKIAETRKTLKLAGFNDVEIERMMAEEMGLTPEERRSKETQAQSGILHPTEYVLKPELAATQKVLSRVGTPESRTLTGGILTSRLSMFDVYSKKLPRRNY